VERAGSPRYAAAILEKALGYFRDSPEIPTALGLLAYRGGNIEGAFSFLLDAVSRDKKDPRPYRWMAIIAKNLGDKDGEARYEREYRRLSGAAGKGK